MPKAEFGTPKYLSNRMKVILKKELTSIENEL